MDDETAWMLHHSGLTASQPLVSVQMQHFQLLLIWGTLSSMKYLLHLIQAMTFDYRLVMHHSPVSVTGHMLLQQLLQQLQTDARGKIELKPFIRK